LKHKSSCTLNTSWLIKHRQIVSVITDGISNVTDSGKSNEEIHYNGKKIMYKRTNNDLTI
jgi:hypothetical protein